MTLLRSLFTSIHSISHNQVLSRLLKSICCYCMAFNHLEWNAEQMDREKLMKMASAVRTGGKGSVRRLVMILYSSRPRD